MQIGFYIHSCEVTASISRSEDKTIHHIDALEIDTITHFSEISADETLFIERAQIASVDCRVEDEISFEEKELHGQAIHWFVEEDISLFDDDIFVCQRCIIDSNQSIRSRIDTDDFLSDRDVLEWCDHICSSTEDVGVFIDRIKCPWWADILPTVDGWSDTDISSESYSFSFVDGTSETDTAQYRQSIKKEIFYLTTLSCSGYHTYSDNTVIHSTWEISEIVSYERSCLVAIGEAIGGGVYINTEDDICLSSCEVSRVMFDIADDILGVTSTGSIESSFDRDIHIGWVCSSEITHTWLSERS